MPSKVTSKKKSPPISVEQDVTVADALDVMRNFGVRHLPVFDGDLLVGLVSERDLKSAMHPKANAKSPVSEVMSKKPYSAYEETSLKDITKVMFENKYGSVLITDSDSALVGIFTTTDALRVLHEFFTGKYSLEPFNSPIKDFLISAN